MFPSILIQLENGPNEFYFNLIKNNIIEFKYHTGMSLREIKKIKLKPEDQWSCKRSPDILA